MIALLGLLGVMLALTVIGVQLTRGRMFSLLTFHAALFVLECGGGAIKALVPDAFWEFSSPARDNPLPFVPLALTVYIAGFALMIYGYIVASYLTRRTHGASDEAMNRFFDARWTFSYKALLLFATLMTIAAGFVPQYFKIRSMGFATFLATAYQHRFGTSTEGSTDTAIVVVTSILASSAAPLVLVWIFAWLRGRLTLAGKTIIVGVITILLVRQVTTMFRSIILATLIAMFAAYVSERRISTGKWIVLGSVMGSIFVAINFVHFYMYYLTAGWHRQGVLGSMEQFLGPHAHVFTLSTLLAHYEGGAPRLGGKGMLESALFFIPRSIWPSKLPSGESGTMLVQAWADLPTYFQMAITFVGEWVVHFGYAGIVMMFVYGLIVGWLDSFYDRGTVARAALFGILIARVLAEAGMGFSALAITLALLAVFLGIMAALDYILAILRWMFSIGRRRRPAPPVAAQPAALSSGGLNAR